ncbi:hypothetical protein [Acetobacter conturbans]|uniref:Uncharacterized protein n=1 Tax=Acetobacter conturbans TaxID=1737472 RepID=A0ABX0K4F0_9PROT|nr:hypothetical protein [Acetobacter conturbans]NHN89691.1 hypothetical protein [Acetobacter conturbans]
MQRIRQTNVGRWIAILLLQVAMCLPVFGATHAIAASHPDCMGCKAPAMAATMAMPAEAVPCHHPSVFASSPAHGAGTVSRQDTGHGHCCVTGECVQFSLMADPPFALRYRSLLQPARAYHRIASALRLGQIAIPALPPPRQVS